MEKKYKQLEKQKMVIQQYILQELNYNIITL